MLNLRYVPSLEYVQVTVETSHGSARVDPATVVVLRRQEVPVAELERGDPVVAQSGWRRASTLDEEMAAGFVRPAAVRAGGSWAEMFARLYELAAPLSDAGWKVVKEMREESREHGDSVMLELEKAGIVIELEYYEDGGLVAFPVEDGSQDHSTRQYFGLEDVTAASARTAFSNQRWI